jgi:hypothetical protein
MLDVLESLFKVHQDFCGLLAPGGRQLCSHGGPPSAVAHPPASRIVTLGRGVVRGPASDFPDSGLHVHTDQCAEKGYGPETSVLLGDEDGVDNLFMIGPGTGIPEVAQFAQCLEARIGQGGQGSRGKTIRGRCAGRKTLSSVSQCLRIERRGADNIGQKLLDNMSVTLIRLTCLPPVLPLGAVVGEDMTPGRRESVVERD